MLSTVRYNGVISNEINPPEVLSTRDAINQNKLRRNKKQQNNKGKENKTLKLSGNVDLGMKENKQVRRKNGTRKASRTTAMTTTPHPNTISEIFQPNHHRHNHYDSRQQPKNYRKTPKQNDVTSRPETVTQSTTSAYSNIENTTLSEIATKLLEKVIK